MRLWTASTVSAALFYGKDEGATEKRVMLPLEKKYEKVCGIMKDRFGRLHEVARLLLDGPFKGLKSGRLDIDVPSGLAVRM